MKTRFPTILKAMLKAVPASALPAAIVAAAAVMPAAFAAQPQAAPRQGSAPAQNLPGITVQGRPDAFTESDRRLAAVQRRLPVMGTDIPPQVTFADRAATYLAAHRDPNRLDVEQQDMLLKMLGLDAIWPNPEQP